MVKENAADAATPATEADTVYVPGVPLAVNSAEVATPDALVVPVLAPPAKVPLAPAAGTVNVTIAPLTGFPLASLTDTTSAPLNAVLTVAIWPLPLVAVICAAGPARFVSRNEAGAAVPGMEAITVYDPAVPLAVKGVVAAPVESVVTVADVPVAKVPVAPVPGALNVTVTPLTGFPVLSVTVATSGAAKAVLTVVL